MSFIECLNIGDKRSDVYNLTPHSSASLLVVHPGVLKNFYGGIVKSIYQFVYWYLGNLATNSLWHTEEKG
jgi:hypothetical protein